MTQPNLQSLLDLDLAHSSQGDTSGKLGAKAIFKRAAGSFLYDFDGVAYLDFQMFNAASSFGHGGEDFSEEVQKQLLTLPSLGSSFLHENRVELASAISQDIEARFGQRGRVHFNVGGAQGIDDALKLVANFTGSTKVFAFEGSYHGRTLAASCLSSSYRYRARFGHLEPARFIPYPYCFRCPYGKSQPECDYYCVDAFARLLESEYSGIVDPITGKVEFRAFFAEPMLGRGGYVVPPQDYFRRLKLVLDEYNILLVMDEVQMGVYRTGTTWAFEHFGVVPDLFVFGKAITNGLWPLSGVWARDPLLSPEIWPPGSAHSTFAAHPIGTGLGLFTLRKARALVQTRSFLEEIESIGKRLVAGLQAIDSSFAVMARIDRKGLAIGVELCHPSSKNPFPDLAKDLALTGLTSPLRRSSEPNPVGLVLSVGGYHDHVLLLSPNLLSTHAEIDLFLELFEEYLVRALKS